MTSSVIQVTIKDIPSDVVAEMLLFIYTGNTPNLNKLAGDLLGAAEQYQLEMLKDICEEKLCSRTAEVNFNLC